MPVADLSPTVYTPRSVSALLSRLKSNPTATLFAGGTHIMMGTRSKYPTLPMTLIHIKPIEELGRIHRTERYLEIGSCTSISTILKIGSNVIPDILSHALRGLATPAIRSTATLGGNLCLPDRRTAVFTVLMLLDTRVELRRSGASRWLPINRLASSEGNLVIQNGEVLTRVRVPLSTWDIQVQRSLPSGPAGSSQSVSFSGLANTQKGMISDLRFAFGGMGKYLIRSREIEAELVGKKLPLQPRYTAAVIEQLGLQLQRASDALSVYQQTMTTNLLSWFLLLLDTEYRR